MSTTDQQDTIGSMRYFVSLTIGALAAVAIVVTLLAVGRPEAAVTGLAAGGRGLGYMAVARRRAIRRSSVAGPAARLTAHVGDERDQRIIEWALARTGYASIWTVAGAAVAAILGADAVAIVAALFVAQLAVFAAAFGVAVRRG